MFTRTHARPLPKTKRRGAAAVELAISLPFLLTLAFGMFEYNSLIMLRARMVSAAYESARLATRPNTSQQNVATAGGVTTYCNTLLSQLGVQGAMVTLTPSDLSTATPQTVVTVSITAPLSRNSLTTLVLGSSRTTTANATLIIE